MSAQHTLGPWKLVELKGGWLIKTKDGCVLADVRKMPEGALLSPQCEANARLMTAAPELLSELQGALMALESHGFTQTARTARAAIAKATWSAA